MDLQIHRIFNEIWQPCRLTTSAGEPLTGSGFEIDEPELEFSSAELSGEE